MRGHTHGTLNMCRRVVFGCCAGWLWQATRPPEPAMRQQESGVPADGAQATDSAAPAAERRSDKLGGLLDSLETVLMKVRASLPPA